MKFSDVQKRKMLEDVLIRNKSLGETAKENGYARRALQRLLARARVHGIENVLHENAQRRYPRDFKYQVVKYVLDGHTLDRSSVEFNVDYHVVRSWFLRYSKGGVEALTADNRGRKSMGRPKKKAFFTAFPFAYVCQENGCPSSFIIVFEVVNRSNVVYCTKEKEYHEYVSDRSVI